MSFKKKIFLWVGVIGILGIGYNAYHWFDGVTQYRIAYLYLEYGIPHFYVDRIVFHKDIPKGISWLYQGAERGNADAESALGAFLINGEGIKKNEKEGFQLLKKSAEKGSADANYNLGTCFFNGNGTLENKEEAFRYIKKASEQMLKNHNNGKLDVNAYYALGQLYDRGEGCEVNKKEAIIWISRAAERGDVNARIALDKANQSATNPQQNP